MTGIDYIAFKKANVIYASKVYFFSKVKVSKESDTQT